MGLFGWLHWLGEPIEKLKLIRDNTTDAKEKELLNEVIETLESHTNKG